MSFDGISNVEAGYHRRQRKKHRGFACAFGNRARASSSYDALRKYNLYTKAGLGGVK